MIDSHALVGSCAAGRRNLAISALQVAASSNLSAALPVINLVLHQT